MIMAGVFLKKKRIVASNAPNADRIHFFSIFLLQVMNFKMVVFKCFDFESLTINMINNHTHPPEKMYGIYEHSFYMNIIMNYRLLY